MSITQVDVKGGIYCLRNTVSGRRYVGQTWKLTKREKEHLGAIRRGTPDNAALRRAVAKYGPDVFVFEVLEFCLRDNLDSREQYWLDHFGIRHLYNSSPFGGAPRGFTRSAEDRARIGERNRLRKVSAETKEKIGAFNRGKKLSAAHIEILRQIHIGRKHSPESIAKGAAKRRGLKRSPETRQKLRDASLRFYRAHNG